MQINTNNRVYIDLPSIVGGGYGKWWRFKGRYRVCKGSRASKKSKTSALWYIYNMMRYPLANVLVARKVATTLRDSCWNDLQWAAHRLGVYHLWQFTISSLSATYKPTGQQIFFRGMDDPMKLASITCTHGFLCWAWLEEAYEFEENDFDMIDDVIRGEMPPGYFKQLSLTFNPWTASSWLKKRFFDVPDTEDKLAITTTYRCNEWLDEADKKRFERMKIENPHRFRVAGDGDWGIDGEAFFEEFRDDPDHYQDRLWTHVIDPFEVPASWKIYRGFDFGYSRPYSVGWFACDHENRLYHILELYGCKKNQPNVGLKQSPDQIFKDIREVEEQHRWLKGKRIRGIADPSIWDKSRGIPIIEMAEKQGIYFDPGDNKRIAGWMQMHYRFNFDENGVPMMYVFRTCENFIRTIPQLQYDEVKPEDLDTDMEDHIADMTRYVCMGRPMNPSDVDTIVPHGYSPLDSVDINKRYGSYDWFNY